MLTKVQIEVFQDEVLETYRIISLTADTNHIATNVMYVLDKKNNIVISDGKFYGINKETRSFIKELDKVNFYKVLLCEYLNLSIRQKRIYIEYKTLFKKLKPKKVVV